jgi:hypothetical protein
LIQSVQDSNESLMEAVADVWLLEDNITKVVYGAYGTPLTQTFFFSKSYHPPELFPIQKCCAQTGNVLSMGIRRDFTRNIF